MEDISGYIILIIFIIAYYYFARWIYYDIAIVSEDDDLSDASDSE